MKKIYDMIIIGAGVVGNAVARELSRYQLSIAVLEKQQDVCCETSARNSGVLHAGFNNKTGSKMAKLCVEGNLGFDQLAVELDVPFKRTGKIVVGFDDSDREQLEKLKAQGEANGVPGLSIIERAQIKQIAPCVEGNFAMLSVMTGVLDPFHLTIGLAENAHHNGAEYYFAQEVKAIDFDDGIYTVQTVKEEFKSRWVVNAAGLQADKVAAMMGVDDYQIYPCRGEYFILDQQMSSLLPLPVYPVPNIKTGGLGIHLTPSIDGNIFVGPSADYINERDDYATTQEVMDMLIEDGSRIFPYLKREYFIRNFSGIRPKLVSKTEGGFHDFVIERCQETSHAINLIGIESPGLTASTPIARQVVRLIEEVEKLQQKANFDPIHRRPVRFRELTHGEQAKLAAENPNYGEIICRCETITKAEVLAAIHNSLGVATIAGIKYRCRAMMGRCQGGYCQTRIADLLIKEKQLKPEEVLFNRDGSYLFTERVRSC